MKTGWDDVVEEFINKNPRGYYWHTEIEEYAREKNIFPAGSNPQLKIKDALKRLGYEQYKNPVTREYKEYKTKKRWWYLSHPEVVSSSDNANREAMVEALNAEAELQEMQERQKEELLEASVEQESTAREELEQAYLDADAEEELMYADDEFEEAYLEASETFTEVKRSKAEFLEKLKLQKEKRKK